MQIIILAAGKGSRMNSPLPKVMHEVAGKPMLEHVVANCFEVTGNLILVYSQSLKPYLHMFDNRCQTVIQEEQLGTAHAVSVARHLFNNDNVIGVIYGDNPLITPGIIRDLFNHLKETDSKAVTLAFDYNKPNQYGRIILDPLGNFKKIIESKSASADEMKVTLCNSGIMAFAPGILTKYIDHCLSANQPVSKAEFYLTSIIEICAAHGEKVSYYKSSDHKTAVGINTKSELEHVNSLMSNVDNRSKQYE